MKTGIFSRLFFLLMAVVIVIGVLFIFGRKKSDNKNESSRPEGVSVIEQEKKTSDVSLEKKLEQIRPENQTKKSPRVRLLPAVIAGDQAAGEFALTDTVYPVNVYFEKGMTPGGLAQSGGFLDGQIPGYVFLAFRMSGIADAKLTPDSMQEEYTKLIDALQKKNPDVKIFVLSLFPVSSDLARKQYAYSNTEAYNEKLVKLCDRLQIPFVDLTDQFQDMYFEKDGISLKTDFYRSVSEKMAEVAGL